MAHSDFDDRHYVIISVDDIGIIDFSQVMETSADTVRKSLDETLTFVKYEHEMPSSVISCPSKSQEYSHSEILEILATTAWTPEETP